MAELLAPDYARERAALISESASTAFRPGSPGGREPWLPPLRTGDGAETLAGTGEPTLTSAGVTRGDTCHIDVIDRTAT